jgi:hypothetical protein
VGAILLFRFAARWHLGETAAWAAFVFLQVWPKMWVGSAGGMYEAGWWVALVSAWEAVVYNPLLDLGGWGVPLVGAAAAAAATRRRWAPAAARFCGRRRGRRPKASAQRDLDV